MYHYAEWGKWRVWWGVGGKYVKCQHLTGRKLEFIPLGIKWTFLLLVTNYDKVNIFQLND